MPFIKVVYNIPNSTIYESLMEKSINDNHCLIQHWKRIQPYKMQALNFSYNCIQVNCVFSQSRKN